MTGHKRGALVLLVCMALVIACKKESEDTKDAGPPTTSQVQKQLTSKVFSLTYSFNAKDDHNLDGTDKKALIYFEQHPENKKWLSFLKVVQDAVTGTHRTLGGSLRFSPEGARMITDYDCPATVTPRGNTIVEILAKMKAECVTTSDAGPPDQGAPDQGASDLGAPDSATPDLGAADMSTADAATADAAASDAAASDGGAASKGTLYTLSINDDTDNRLYVEDAEARMTLSRIFRKKPSSSLDADTLKRLNVWERVTHQNSCDATNPAEYLAMYTDADGKVLYSRVIDNFSKNGTYGVEEGTVSSRGTELTFKPLFKGDCKSKLRLNPSKRPVFPPNLWLTRTNCTTTTAAQEVFYSTSADRKCNFMDVTGLALKGHSTRTYISRKGGAYPATTGTGAHIFWSIYTGN